MKIAIVDLKTKQVQTTYESDVIYMSKFGGPWADPLIVEHVKIPQDLELENPFNLEPYDGEEQVGSQMIRDGEEAAYSSSNKPLKDADGELIMIPKYIEVPVMQARRLMRLK